VGISTLVQATKHLSHLVQEVTQYASISVAAYSLLHNMCYLAFISVNEWPECSLCHLGQLCSFYFPCCHN